MICSTNKKTRGFKTCCFLIGPQKTCYNPIGSKTKGFPNSMFLKLQVFEYSRFLKTLGISKLQVSQKLKVFQNSRFLKTLGFSETQGFSKLQVYMQLFQFIGQTKHQKPVFLSVEQIMRFPNWPIKKTAVFYWPFKNLLFFFIG